jgi:excisionase family DNA binding protein
MSHAGRQKEPRIIDPRTHPRPFVGLRVAGEYLGLNERTVRARIESGDLPATVDGRVYKIAVVDLMAYDARRHAA